MAESSDKGVVDLESSPDEMTLEVTIPENTVAGDQVTIQCPNNSFVQFVTPENVVSGDRVHVHISGTSDDERNGTVPAEEKGVSDTSYKGIAAVTTGVVVSAFVIGPIVTGVLVVGMVIAAAQRKKAKPEVGPADTVDEGDLEGGSAFQEVDSPGSPAPSKEPEPETREQKIATALVQTADYIADKLSAFDERFAISGSTLKAIAAVQELDERNKISETVITSVKTFDEKYQVSGTASAAVNTTVTKVKEFDENYKVTENIVTAGSNFAHCVTDLERQYDITTRITSALIYTLSSVSHTLNVYMNRIAYGSDRGDGPLPAADGAEPMLLSEHESNAFPAAVVEPLAVHTEVPEVTYEEPKALEAV